jgi:beta-phosphoglucomutase
MGYIFDMDGTMVDNMMVHHRAWQILLKRIGLDLDMEAVRQTIHGKNDEILLRLFGDRYTQAEREQLAWEKEAAYREVFKDELSLIPGLQEFLDFNLEHGHKMAIGSAAPPENVDFVLDALGLRHYFGAVVHAGHVRKGKPDPEVFHMAAEEIGLEASQCIVFEDSPVGVHTALNAGCKAIVVTTTHTEVEFAQFPNVIGFIKDFRSVHDLL